LFVATRESHLAYLSANFEKQRALGLEAVKMLPGEEIARMLPQLRSDDILGGSFCPTDGFVDPYSAMNGFMAAALDQGAALWKKTAVTGIERQGGAIAAVNTARGRVSTRVVVNAAGPWAGEVARMAGIDLPVQPLRRMLVPSEPFDGFPHDCPMVIDMSNGFHFRPEGRGFLLAWNDPEESSQTPAFDPAFVEKILVLAASRVPGFENLPVNPRRGWAGLYEMSPDHHCILGPVRQLPGFYLANGFSGHGVMHAPSTGKILSDLILEGKTGVVSDVSLVSLERFDKGQLLEETAVL
jgi:sarcosine oxidase subunit beta